MDLVELYPNDEPSVVGHKFVPMFTRLELYTALPMFTRLELYTALPMFTRLELYTALRIVSMLNGGDGNINITGSEHRVWEACSVK